MLNINAPAITSECPPIYFVHECETMSAPNKSGFVFIGLENVLSTQRRIPVPFKASAIFLISKHFSVGFVGVSSQQILVEGLIAFLNSFISVKSINVISLSAFGFKIFLRYL